MREATVTTESTPQLRPDTPYDLYHKIHKRFVGPATADKLVGLYEDISLTQRPREMFAAGWAAAEAALVGTHYTARERDHLADAAIDCWEYALQLEQERASESAQLRNTTPDCTEQYRYASTLALAPIIRSIPHGIIPKDTLNSSFLNLLEVAELNNIDMMQAMRVGQEGRAAAHMGLAFEHIAALGVNRKRSSRIVGIFSLARSGTGFHYPKQTHDLMVLNLDKDRIVRYTPTEVKSQLKERFSIRYDAALVGGKALIGEDRSLIGSTLELFRQELAIDLSADDRQYLENISESIIHSVRHHQRAEKIGRHCLKRHKCALSDGLSEAS